MFHPKHFMNAQQGNETYRMVSVMKTGYKQTEIGVIPEDWEVKKISECTDYVDYRGKTPKKTTSGRFLVTAKNIRTGYIDYEISKEYVPEDEYISIMKRGLPLIGDIVITTEAPLGNVALIDREDIALAQRVIKYRANVNFLNYGYLKHYFLSEKFQKILDDNSSGSTAKGIKGSVLHKLPIILPQLPEQTTIAAALSDVDALMGELDKLIAKRRDIKQATMQQLLTGKKRLAGFSGEWEVKKLNDVCGMKSGEAITSSNINEHFKYPCYGGNGLRGFTERFTHNGCYALIGRQGALCGNVSSVTGTFFASEHAVVVTPFAQTDIYWLTFMLGKLKLNQYSESSAQPGLSISKILKLSLPVPPTIEEQTAIANILSDMDAEINALQQKRDKTAQLKQGMMQELLTGQIRLNP